MKKFKVLALLTLLVLSLSLVTGSVPVSAKSVKEFHGAAGWPRPPGFHGNPWAPGGVGGCYWYVFEPLFYYLPGNMTFIPRLGVSFKVEGNNLIVKLRKGVTWHDGKPFTSKDVRITWLLGGAIARWGWWKYIEDVETPDDFTVVFKCTSPPPPVLVVRFLGEAIKSPYHLYGKWESKAAEVIKLQKRVWKLEAEGRPVPSTLKKELEAKRSALVKEVFAFKPWKEGIGVIGTGPFVLKKVTTSEMYLEKYPKHYAANTTHFDAIRIYFWSSNEVVWGLLMAGLVDAAHPASTPDIVKMIFKAQPGMKLVLPSDLGEFCLAINFRLAKFHDLALRKALLYALNRKKIREVCYYYALDVDHYNHGVLKSFEKMWLSPEFLAKLTDYSYNPKKAEETLKKAGYYKGGDGLWRTPKGEVVKVEVSVYAPYSDWVLAADEVVRELRDFGFAASLRLVPLGMYGPTLRAGKYELAIEFGTAWWGTGMPATGYERLYLPHGYIRTVTQFPANKTFDTPWGPLCPEKLAWELLRTSDLKKQKELVEKLAYITNEYVPVIHFLEKRLMIYILSGVRVTGWPAPDDPVWTIAPGGIERCYVLLLTKGVLKPVES